MQRSSRATSASARAETAASRTTPPASSNALRRAVAFACALAAAAAGATGCGGAGKARQLVRSDAAAPAERCGPPNVPAEPVSLEAGDGTRLDGAIVGRGPVGVVFVHEYPGPANGPYCGWWPFAAWLAQRGVHSLLLNLRCFGESDCPAGDARADSTDDVRGAIDALTAAGAKKVVLAGASLGGVVVVKAAAEIRPAVAGIVDLSGEVDLGTLLGGDVELDAGAAAPGVTSPALLAVARGDGYTPLADMRTVYRRLASKDKRLIVEPARFGHGWDMLRATDSGWSRLAYQILAFVRRLSRT